MLPYVVQTKMMQNPLFVCFNLSSVLVVSTRSALLESNNLMSSVFDILINYSSLRYPELLETRLHAENN